MDQCAFKFNVGQLPAELFGLAQMAFGFREIAAAPGCLGRSEMSFTIRRPGGKTSVEKLAGRGGVVLFECVLASAKVPLGPKLDGNKPGCHGEEARSDHQEAKSWVETTSLDASRHIAVYSAVRSAAAIAPSTSLSQSAVTL